jgi:hypothetical protein
MTTQDEDIPAKARGVVRSCDRATLATATADESWPYGSLVMTACDPDASPLLLISELAEHTKNLHADGRAALLFDGTAGLANPLTGTRVTVLGRLARCDDDAARRRYLARHPDAAEYAGFGDFGLYRMAVERAHIVAGFGVIHWIDSDDLLYDAALARELADREADIVGHMNADHGEAIALYATSLLDREGGAWTMTGIDPEGCDLRCGGRVARLAFDAPVHDAAAARAALVALVSRGRETMEKER